MADIKAAFYDVKKFLSSHPSSSAQRLMGSACENWLRTEICSILNFENGKGISKHSEEFAYDEVEKRDISIYKGNESPQLLHHIELKVVYPSYSLTPNAEWITSLRRQLERPLKTNEPINVRRHGWVFSIWTTYYSHIAPESYFQKITDCLTNSFEVNEYTAQHDFRAELILDAECPWRGATTQVILKGSYFSRRKM